jgi:hypothetical protein
MAFIRAPVNARLSGELRALLEVCQSRIAANCAARLACGSVGQGQPNLESEAIGPVCYVRVS